MGDSVLGRGSGGEEVLDKGVLNSPSKLPEESMEGDELVAKASCS